MRFIIAYALHIRTVLYNCAGNIYMLVGLIQFTIQTRFKIEIDWISIRIWTVEYVWAE